MLIALDYGTKKKLKASVGLKLNYMETSIFGPEYSPNGVLTMTNLTHNWFATVTMKGGIIQRVE